MTATTLTLNADVSWAELVDATATQVDMPRVAPGDLEGSYLWHKLQGTQMDVGGMGTAILSTSHGVMTGHDARKAGVGGEVVAEVW